ncbi:MAG: TonB-dependent receptor family protein [Taibaiella sp.]|nr:TonB-dependent receptor family protein [Taibaiella sp.]
MNRVQLYKALCILALLALMSFVSAHAQYKLSGKITVDREQATLEKIIVQLVNAENDSTINSMPVDKDGNFSIKALEGHYLINFEWDSYILEQKSVALKSDTDLGIISLSLPVYDALKGVAVTAKAQSLKIEDGKLIYTPAINSAQSAFEVLQTTPTLTVTDEAIQLNGNGNPRIMINGRWQRMPVDQLLTYLKSLPAQKIKSIQVVRNPGAEQDAENNSGYINIILRDQKEQGYLGSLSMNAFKATYFNYNPAINLSAHLGKLQLNANLGYSNGKMKTPGSNFLHFPDKYWEEHNRQVRTSNALPLSVNADYQLNKKHLIGAGITYQHSRYKSDEHNQTDIFNLNRTQIDSSLLTKGKNPETMSNLSLNVNYTYNINDSGRKISIDLNHYEQNYNRLQEFTNFRFDASGQPTQAGQSFRSGNDQRMLISTANIDVQHPLKWLNLNYGAKFSYISNQNRTSFYQYLSDNWEPDNNRFDHFTYDESTYALFARASKEVQKWSLSTGLRWEFTETMGISKVYNIRNKNNYARLFPSASIGYNPSTTHNYSLNYSRRIDRPFFGQVNPFRWYHTQYAFTNGNPSLQPYFSHNIELNYVLHQKWFFGAYYSRSDGMFSEYDLVDPVSNFRETRVDNILDLNVYGLNASAQAYPLKFWLLIPQAGISYTRIFSKADFLNYSAGTFVYSALYQQFNLDEKKQWLFDANTYVYAPRNYGIMQLKTLWTQSFKLTYATSDTKWQFVLSANDVFRSAAMRYNSIINETLRERYVYRDQRHIGLTVRYNFKNGTTQAKREKSQSNEEEMDRTRG